MTHETIAALSAATETYRTSETATDTAREAWHAAIRAADAAGQPKTLIARTAGVRRSYIYRLIALVLAALALTACGGTDEPSTHRGGPAPAIDTSGRVLSSPVATVAVPATETAPTCWALGSPEDLAWTTKYNESGNETRATMAAQLPAPSEACDPESAEALMGRHEEGDRLGASLTP